MDWADFYDQETVVKEVNKLTDKLISEIFNKKISVYHGLGINELALLIRYPIYIGISAFVEKLLRIMHQKETNACESYPSKIDKPPYFKDIEAAIVAYYYDHGINFRLLNDISSIINGNDVVPTGTTIELSKPQVPLLAHKPKSFRGKLREAFKGLANWYVSKRKPPIVGDYSHWLSLIFPRSQMIYFNFNDQICNEAKATRQQIKEACQTTFISQIDNILGSLGSREKEEISVLFADFVDHVLPFSVVEGLEVRLKYYRLLLEPWDIKEVHSFTGYYYNENFKVFALLAKRKGARLISHAHGISNVTPYYKNISNEFVFLDYYFCWGRKNSDWLMGDTRFGNLKILPMGSPFLSSMKKWKKKSISQESITLLYPSGPLMDFMSHFEEPTPEKNRQHRLKVLSFLGELLSLYPGLNILYKPFPGTYENDPIKEFFSKEIDEGRIQLIKVAPKSLYDKVDIVLWDFISTGFAESIQSGVPTIVFQTVYEYEKSSQLGRDLYKSLMECQMIFHDAKSGVKSFNCIIQNLPYFMASRTGPVKGFQEAIASAVSKNEFLHQVKLAMEGEKP